MLREANRFILLGMVFQRAGEYGLRDAQDAEVRHAEVRHQEERLLEGHAVKVQEEERLLEEHAVKVPEEDPHG